MATGVKSFKWSEYETDEDLVRAIAEFASTVEVLLCEDLIHRDPQVVVFYALEAR